MQWRDSSALGGRVSRGVAPFTKVRPTLPSDRSYVTGDIDEAYLQKLEQSGRGASRRATQKGATSLISNDRAVVAA
jgi:hypothetical protein